MSCYPTKRDAWLMAILWISTGLMVHGLVVVLREPIGPLMKLFAVSFFAVLVVICGLMCVLPYWTRYCLGSGKLTVKIGPFTSSIRLSEITEVFPTRNPLSAPAWSLDRLRIRYASSRYGALISPVRKEQFLREMASLAPHLELKGNRLVLKEAERAAAAH